MLIYVIILNVICIILITLLCKYKYKIAQISKAQEINNRDSLKWKNKISMVEYYCRQYEEGKNPYTVFRSLCDLVRGDDE